MALYAFDGTWNSEKDAGRYDLNTNVVRFKDLYLRPKFFYKGVGTKHGLVGKIVGGAFGVGGQERIEDAKRAKRRDRPGLGLCHRRRDVPRGALRRRGRWDHGQQGKDESAHARTFARELLHSGEATWLPIG